MSIQLDDQEKTIIDGVEKYKWIKNELETGGREIILSKHFQTKYDDFYKVRRGEQWRSTYFKLMYEWYCKETSFANIITTLKIETGRVEASFASKLLHTLDNGSPIWDKKVVDFLVKKGVIERPKPYGDKRLKERIKTFHEIKKWYKNKSNIQPLVDYFNQNYKTGRSDEISDVKKADFIIWGLDLDKVLEIADSTPAGV